MSAVLRQQTLLHEQVREILLSRIASGEWSGQRLLPGDHELSREFGVSIGTVRKALERLVQENMIVRERGRGTFLQTGAKCSGRWALNLGRPGEPPLAIRFGEPRLDVAPRNGVVERMLCSARRIASVSPLARLRREWWCEGEVVALETIYVSDARFPGLRFHLKQASDSLQDLYEVQYRVAVAQLEWKVSLSSEMQTSDDSGRSLFRIAYDKGLEPIEVMELQVTAPHLEVSVVHRV